MRNIPVDYKVDKGVPIPVKVKSILAELEVGDSIEVPVSDRTKMANQASYLKRTAGKDFTSRKVSKDVIRFWRTG